MIQMPKFSRPHMPHFQAKTWAILIRFLAGSIALFLIFMSFRINTKAQQIAEQNRVIGEDIRTIARQTKKLAEDSAKTTDQNNVIGKESQAHIDCLAELFANYTRNGRPITVVDLNTCQASSTAASTGNSPQSSTTPPAAQPGSTNPAPASTDQRKSQQNQDSNNNSDGTTEKPPVDIFGIPACVPFTKACIR